MDKLSCTLDSLELLPHTPWDSQFHQHWKPGETGATESLSSFLHQHLNSYKEGRDFPELQSVSKLSPHLHFGEISPKQIMQALSVLPSDSNSEHFKKELYWREFSYYLLFNQPDLPEQNMRQEFNHFPWSNNPDWLKLWQQGRTGNPLIDAGMRELWQTGYMHNRVRMITASFLVKNLMIDWRLGAGWFWNCLVDADLACNSTSWQWVAGCGTDATPYFRIFNPITQGEKFDPDGVYTKRFIPELKELPSQYLFKPWETPEELLEKSHVRLGETYPLPIVDIRESRKKALEAYEQIRNSHKY